MLSIRTKALVVGAVGALAVSLVWGYPLLHRSLAGMNQAREAATRGGYEIGNFNWLNFWVYGLPLALRILLMFGILALLCAAVSAMIDRRFSGRRLKNA